ncbi:cytochrome b/b6 domain-containing protein [Paraburkholderia edwinii]|uniref:Cytochrome b/b6 domain-containing protein n=1 Tax=Paraburkholderia edwinii TaxID=2861782 RepID=A0ABX8ULF4_9BURK|nr:cytochrome b/b6 domain-containing protein [Paraburkholderia edwinii]QYD69855.1 cytochrome b/b6 domain-containing protein [Paraburkholderia edwinii]
MSDTARIRIWDWWVRVTHWVIAGIVIWNLFGPTDPLHRKLGYAAAALVGVRIVWGMIGTRYARFSAWWPTRSRLLAYLRSLASGKPSRHLSHNPLGALMALMLWVLVIALALTGWLMRLDAFWGEDWPQEIHTLLAVALEVCVCVHIAATIVMSVWTRENLIAAMLTGYKRTDKSTDKCTDTRSDARHDEGR